jgi:uncharacterized protein involved in tolerance to divalent cations
MTRSHLSRYVWLGMVILVVASACGLLSNVPLPSLGSGPSPAQNFPLTPNPLNVQITLDKQHVIRGDLAQAGVIRQESLVGKDAKGNSLDVIFPGDFLTQAADGSYEPAFGTAVTATAVSAIGGIPFAKGFVAAFQFGPDGLLMSQPVYASLDVPGNYTDLVGFASNGDGTDFHLIPIDAGPLGSSGQTNVSFYINHFSMYGVAEATAAEITAQQAHPPSNPDSQDDELLAAPYSITRENLSKEHDRLLKSLLANLNACNNVVNAARSFMKWYGNVQSGGQQNHFKDTINKDANTLISRLKDCLQISCPACLQTQDQAQKQNPGQSKSQVLKQKQAAAKTFMVQADYIESFALLLNNSADANLYRELSRKCAVNAGLKDPSPPVADCGGTNCAKVTPTELACPAP